MKGGRGETKTVYRQYQRTAVAVLQSARSALFYGVRVEAARKDKRVRALEWAICDALRAARGDGGTL
ncbi:MAG: hypothetical protein JO223_06365 [Hyphomicrobiales bacterium]|nr:hypothetical protein [Hyphomicrobiales bacterium]